MQRKVPSAIANITLNRATFTDVLIDGLTFVNFFYGNNGAGKSSIAHAIAEDDGVVWADGKTVDDFDVLVYNQDFINDNFVNYGDLKGVFIFGEEDIEAKKKIAELTNQKKQKMDARQTALDEYKKKSDGLASALTQFQDTCFSAKSGAFTSQLSWNHFTASHLYFSSPHNFETKFCLYCTSTSVKRNCSNIQSPHYASRKLL